MIGHRPHRDCWPDPVRVMAGRSGASEEIRPDAADGEETGRRFRRRLSTLFRRIGSGCVGADGAAQSPDCHQVQSEQVTREWPTGATINVSMPT